jgi:hypothetical protein
MKEIRRKMRKAVVLAIIVVCMALPAQFVQARANETMAGLLDSEVFVVNAGATESQQAMNGTSTSKSARPDIKMAPRQTPKAKSNGSGDTPAEIGAEESPPPVNQPQPDPQTAQKLVAARARIHETLGKVALAIATTPRYRHLPLGDITSLILDPLINDRIAIATSAKADGTPDTGDTAGIAIWASVSAEVDAKIREQIEGRRVSCAAGAE